MALHINTPLLQSPAISRASGVDAWLKMEALQPPGSFKIRGVGLLCEHHAAAGKRRFVSSSGGNAGIAAACAGRRLSIPVSVFVPETTTERAQALIREQGAEVMVHGASWQEANELALSTLDDETAFIHPFDDPLLWRGHATLVDEVVNAGVPFNAVVLSVGGGGLLCGVAEGLERNGLAHVPIIAVETQGAQSLAAAMMAGNRVELPAITSIATSLGARRVCERAFVLSRTRPVQSVVVKDAEALAACHTFLDQHRVLVEPACGAALAIAYRRSDKLSDYNSVLFVVCGGATASLEQLAFYKERIVA
jgi:L-serine/L-threonine ammonia-lyase